MTGSSARVVGFRTRSILPPFFFSFFFHSWTFGNEIHGRRLCDCGIPSLFFISWQLFHGVYSDTATDHIILRGPLKETEERTQERQ